MSRPKIAIYTMAKNEAAHVDRYMQTTYGADAIVVTDTGSTDGTPDLLREAGAQIHTACVNPWRFDIASNVALAHIPADIDICVKLDLDEVLWTQDGSQWRTEIDQLWQERSFHQLRYWYTWSWHIPGEVPAVRFRQGHIHHRAGYRWQHPGHAALIPPVNPRVVGAERLEIHHYPTEKERPDYLPLLQLAVEENQCPRTLFYLGREYFFRRDFVAAINTLETYLQHEKSNWAAERAEAMRMIGVSWQNLNDTNRAVAKLMAATAERPQVRDLWFELQRFFITTGDFAGAYWATTKCLAITQRDREYTGTAAEAWSELPFVYGAKVAAVCGYRDKAAKLIAQALEFNPHSTAAREVAIGLDLSTGS